MLAAPKISEFVTAFGPLRSRAPKGTYASRDCLFDDLPLRSC